MLNLAKQIRKAQKAGEDLGLSADELAFYDALTKPQAIKDFYENAELIAITKELAEKLRKSRTIDWQKRDSARAKMRMMIRKLLKDHRYEETNRRSYGSLSELQDALFRYIHGFYNSIRPHSHNNGVSPIDAENLVT